MANVDIGSPVSTDYPDPTTPSDQDMFPSASIAGSDIVGSPVSIPAGASLSQGGMVARTPFANPAPDVNEPAAGTISTVSDKP